MSRPGLFQQVMGPDYALLSLAVQRFHDLQGHQVLHGRVQTHAPASALSRWLARLLGTPLRASSGALRFVLDAGPDAQVWTRHFPAQTMRSRMRVVDGRLEEQLGAARLIFRLTVVDAALDMVLERMHFWGLPCPTWLLPRIVAQESGDEARLHFRIVASLPLIGTVASYQGHLDLDPVIDLGRAAGAAS